MLAMRMTFLPPSADVGRPVAEAVLAAAQQAERAVIRRKRKGTEEWMSRSQDGTSR